jgi:aspartate/methionine/tyrosine aminotransferase
MTARRTERVKSSAYMHWAKTRAHPRFDLATSDVMRYPLAELPVTLDELEISGPSFYGYAPLQEALAAKCGVDKECVVAATGTSMANHLAMAALLEPGDEVLVERPAYDPLLSVARYLGADVRRFERTFENGFRIDPEEVARRVSPRTRLVVITNLHNPSSAFTDEATLGALRDIARGVGARVLVDEVYLDAVFERAPPTAFKLGPEFVVTSSLTKVYGLSGLRCGWVLAEAALAQKMWRLNDLFGAIPAHAAELLSCAALRHLGHIAARSRRLLEENARVLDSFLAARDDLDYTPHEFGTVSFPRLKRGDAQQLCALLAEKYETSVVPGDFFEMPRHIRIGIGGDTATLTEGLDRLGRALDEVGR